MRVLVTGGAGFIGSNLVRRLVVEEAVTEVRVIDDFSTGYRENLKGLDVTLLEASILEANALASAIDGCQAVVHLAALGSVPRSIIDPVSSHEANATGTLRVLEAARTQAGAHVVLASSSSVYGANPQLPKVESMLCQPLSPYAVSKLATEQYAMAYSRCYQLPVLPFRFFNVYGPRQMPGHPYAAVIPVFIEAALTGRPLPLHGDGEQSRDFTFVDTVTEVITRAITDGVTSSPTNLAFGTRTTLNELIERISNVTGRNIQVERGSARPGDVRHSQADNAQLRGLFPMLEPVHLDTGLQKTIEWMSTFLKSRT